jgi:protein-S-isoprenylcysteine O-methyltransferase Ste14
VGLVGVAYLDWWHWYEPPVVVQLVSVLVFVAGTALSIWAMWTLGFWESSGLEGHLQTEGPYRFSRNPQYVGFIAMLASGGLLAGSIQTVILAIGGIVWFLLAPHAEEPWLREQYGDAYEEYLRSVPRFLGRTHREPPRQEQTDRTKRGNQ